MTGTTTRIPLRRLVGRYQLVDPIADGGMGSVWRVWDVELGEYVAAKLLRPADAGSLLRFVREQSLRIVHPHVVAPTGWAAEDDQVLLTMDLVRGGSAAQLLGDYGPLYLSYAAVLIDQLLDALGAVHGRGVVHRDVKPSNLLLEPTGRDRPVLRLADFGIAAMVGQPRLTQPDLMVGSPGYLAPESARGAAPDVRQDLYSVGVVAVELLTGEAATEDLPELPRPVSEVLRALLAPSPGDRPETAGAARRAWQDAVERAGVPPIDPARPDAIEVFEHVGPLPDGFGRSGPIAAGGFPWLPGPVVGVDGSGPAPEGVSDGAGPASLLRLHIRERVARRTAAVLGASALAFVVVLAAVLATHGNEPTGAHAATPAQSVDVSETPALGGPTITTSSLPALPSTQPNQTLTPAQPNGRTPTTTTAKTTAPAVPPADPAPVVQRIRNGSIAGICVGIRQSTGPDVVIGSCDPLSASQQWYRKAGPVDLTTDGGRHSYYQYANKQTNTCLGVNGNSTASGTGLVIGACQTASNQSQLWASVDQGGGRTALVNGRSGLCLGTEASGTGGGTLVEQGHCDATPTQDWDLA